MGTINISSQRLPQKSKYVRMLAMRNATAPKEWPHAAHDDPGPRPPPSASSDKHTHRLLRLSCIIFMSAKRSIARIPAKERHRTYSEATSKTKCQVAACHSPLVSCWGRYCCWIATQSSLLLLLSPASCSLFGLREALLILEQFHNQHLSPMPWTLFCRVDTQRSVY